MLDYKWNKYAKTYFIKNGIFKVVYLIIFNFNAIVIMPNKIMNDPYID